ncbi:MAG: hypothetical protein HY402_04445 [Elusimicrobia bacterium]|nr:hypothetical protein [Elusimicrobiota bacterium]
METSLYKKRGLFRIETAGAMAGIALVLLLLQANFSHAQGKWSGYIFGDAYWFAAHHTKKFQGQNGVWLRRIYLTYDYDIGDNFATRLRMEASQSDFTAAATTMQPFLKDAYLEWKCPTAPSSLFFGLSASPTWDEIENFWGYRPVEKTPLDLQKWGGSRDVGLAARGFWDKEKTFGYHAMVGSGSDTKQETNKNKKLYLALDGKVAGWYVQAYGDYENNRDGTPGSSWYTLQGFIGWKSEGGRLGVQYAHQVREVTPAPDLRLDILSAFAVKKLAEKWSAFARLDYHADPNPDASKITYFGLSGSGATNVNTAKNTLLVFGADYSRAEGKVHLMPNVEVFLFGKNGSGERPKEVVIPRLTAYYKF